MGPKNLAGGPGFEPRRGDPESPMLPLHHPPTAVNYTSEPRMIASTLGYFQPWKQTLPQKACDTAQIDVDYMLAGKECNVHGKKDCGLVWS